MLFYCYCGYLLQISKWLLEAEGYHKYMVNCTAGHGRWMVLYNAVREEWNQHILWLPKKLNILKNPHMPNSPFMSMVFKTTSASSEAALEPSLRLSTLPGHCSVLWPLFRASLLLHSPRLTPSQAPWTQQSPAHSLSLGWCRLDLVYPGDWTATSSLWCNSKFALSVQKPMKKTHAFKDKLIQLKFQYQYLNLSFLQAIKHRTWSQGGRMNENRLELKTKYFCSCCLF